MRKHRLELTGEIVTADARDGVVGQRVIRVPGKLADNTLVAFAAKFSFIIEQ